MQPSRIHRTCSSVAGARWSIFSLSLQPDVVIAGPVQSGSYLAALAGAKPLVTVSWGTDLLVDADATDESRAITRYALDNSSAVFGDCLAVREAVHRHSVDS